MTLIVEQITTSTTYLICSICAVLIKRKCTPRHTFSSRYKLASCLEPISMKSSLIIYFANIDMFHTILCVRLLPKLPNIILFRILFFYW